MRHIFEKDLSDYIVLDLHDHRRKVVKIFTIIRSITIQFWYICLVYYYFRRVYRLAIRQIREIHEIRCNEVCASMLEGHGHLCGMITTLIMSSFWFYCDTERRGGDDFESDIKNLIPLLLNIFVVFTDQEFREIPQNEIWVRVRWRVRVCMGLFLCVCVCV